MENKQVVITNSNQGSRIIKSYRYKGIAYRLTDDAFKDVNGNLPSQRYARLLSGNNIFNTIDDAPILRFLIGEEGTSFMGCPEIMNSRAHKEMMKNGQPMRPSKLEFVDYEKKAQERQTSLETQKNAAVLLARVLDNEQLTKDICYVFSNYSKDSTASIYEGDLTDKVLNQKRHVEFMGMFKDNKAKGKDLAIKDDLLNLSMFRQGMAKGLITIKDNGYYNGSTLLGYQEGGAVVALVENNERWQFFLSELKKVKKVEPAEA